jgi:hypothetical protein
MRNVAWLFAVALALGLAGPAWAQKSLGPWARVPSQIQNRPIDLSQSVVPQVPAPTFKPFSLVRFIPKMWRPGAPSQIGVSPLPPPSAFPSTQYPNGFKSIPDMPKKK